VILGLKKAQILSARPDFIPKSLGRGVKATGRQFENRVGKKLLSPLTRTGKIEVRHSVWFEFLDANGRGVCEADYLIICPDRVVVVEVKLTQTPRGLSQLGLLYLPLVRMIFPGVIVQGVMVCKKLYQDDGSLVSTWDEILKGNGTKILTWQWLG